jgi:hypothetical protein
MVREDSQERADADDAFHLHPFPDFCDRICGLTGIDKSELRAAATVGFSGRQEVISALLPWEGEVAIAQLYGQLIEEHSAIAVKCGLTANEVAGEKLQDQSNAEQIKWLAHPFWRTIEHLAKDDPRRSGTFGMTPQVQRIMNTPVVLPTVEPDETELAILKRHYPDTDPAKPPWKDIQADLLVGGISPETLHQTTTRQWVRMLDRVKQPDPTQLKEAADKEKLLDHFRRRGLAPIAYMAEAAWNLREWLREITTDDTLQPVMAVFLPRIRHRLELSLIDAELSRFAPSLPSGTNLTAANIISFIDGLELPGNARLGFPPGQPPKMFRWNSLSRLRAIRVALQVIDPKTSNEMFNVESESDLQKIEGMDKKTLVYLWNAIEDFDPINTINDCGSNPQEREIRDTDGSSNKDTLQNQQESSSTDKARKATVDDRMKAEMAANLDKVKGWTAQQWANHLSCSKGTIGETKTWKQLGLLRAQAKAERQLDRHRKNKPRNG